MELKELHNDIIGELEGIRANCGAYGYPETDVRLRYFEGDWEIKTGDSQYDTDHRGFWGASSVCEDAENLELQDIAVDLVEQVMDDIAQAGEPLPQI